MSTRNDFTGSIETPSGLGGWLILPILHLISTPLFSGYFLLNEVKPLFDMGFWEMLTTPGSPAYVENFDIAITIEIFYNIGISLFAVVLLVLMFRKYYLMPRLMIIFYSTIAVFTIIDTAMFEMIFPDEVENEELYRDLLRNLAFSAIWIPYFIRSERVKATFIKPQSAFTS